MLGSLYYPDCHKIRLVEHIALWKKRTHTRTHTHTFLHRYKTGLLEHIVEIKLTHMQ